MDCCRRITWATRSFWRISTALVGILVRALRGNYRAQVHDGRPADQSDVYRWPMADRLHDAAWVAGRRDAVDDTPHLAVLPSRRLFAAASAATKASAPTDG